MPIGRWRKGLSGATSRERLVLLQAEAIARERAFGEWYSARCEEFDSILVDATDLDVRSVRLEWARCDGHLLIILRCFARDPGRVRTYRWRVNVSTAIGQAFDGVVRQGLKERQS